MRAIAFLPAQLELTGVGFVLQRPSDADFPGRRGPCAVLRRVGGELMYRQAEALRRARREENFWSTEFQPRSGIDECAQMPTDEITEVRACPVLIDQDVVR